MLQHFSCITFEFSTILLLLADGEHFRCWAVLGVWSRKSILLKLFFRQNISRQSIIKFTTFKFTQYKPSIILFLIRKILLIIKVKVHKKNRIQVPYLDLPLKFSMGPLYEPPDLLSVKVVLVAFLPPSTASCDIFCGEVGFVGDLHDSVVSLRSRLIVLQATLRYTFLLLALLYTASSSSKPFKYMHTIVQNEYNFQSLCTQIHFNSNMQYLLLTKSLWI